MIYRETENAYALRIKLANTRSYNTTSRILQIPNNGLPRVPSDPFLPLLAAFSFSYFGSFLFSSRVFISADFLLCARIPFTIPAVRFDLIIFGSALLDIRMAGFAVVKTVEKREKWMKINGWNGSHKQERQIRAWLGE